MKIALQLEGLDCAACAAELEEEISKVNGIKECSVTFMTQRIELEYETEEALERAKDIANHFEEVKVVDGEPSAKKVILQLEGLDCAACAAELEAEIAKVPGIKNCLVAFIGQKLALEYETEEALKKAKEIANHFEEVKVVEGAPVNTEKNGKTIKLQNLHCAACAAELQEEIEKIEGVEVASVDFVGQSIYVEPSDESVIKKVIKVANHFEKVKVVNEDEVLPKTESRLKEYLQLGVGAAFFLGGILFEKLWSGQGGVIASIICFVLAYLSVGYPVLISTGKNVIKGKIFDENFLMTIASLGAFALSEFSEAVAVMWLYQLGELLQSVAVGSSRKSISSLMDLRSEHANLIKGDQIVTVKPEELSVGDHILVKSGEKIPVDGVVIEGVSQIDTKSLTGEAMPVEVTAGSEILSGCINIGANVTLKVIREYTDSAVAKILDLVENSAAKKAAPEKFITKFAKYYTPIVCLIALLIAVLIPLGISIASGGFVWGVWAEWIKKALGLLVISCPCAIIISVPLTYFGGIGCAARYGILAKGAVYLDEVAQVKIAAFDKTGTLTEGNFEIVNIKGFEDALRIAAAAEKMSSHPLSKPFMDIETDYVATDVREIPGKGIQCRVNGEDVLVGNYKLLRENGITVEPADSFSTIIYVAKGGRFIGFIEIDDKLKKETVQAIAALKQAGIEKCVIVTGDNEPRAQKVATEIGEIDEVYSGLLPNEKISAIENLKREGKVLYVGDGINDAPVMAVADCSFSMGKIGSGAAIEASDFVLISDDLNGVPDSVKISRKTRNIVLENIVFSLLAKLSLMVVLIVFELPLALAVFGDVGVMLLAVLNSLRMRLPIKK